MLDLTFEMNTQNISHTWMTTIQENIIGIEKRSAIYTWPRVSFNNKLYFGDQDKKRFIRANFLNNINNTWGIPIVSDRTTLTSTASAGQSSITVDEATNRHFYAGRDCVLISLTDWETYEVATISAISGTTLTLSGTLDSTWPAGTNIYPFYECRIEQEQTRDVQASNVNSINISARESFEEHRTFSYTLPTIDTDVFPVYNSLNLFLYKPIDPITELYIHPFSIFGPYGIQSYYSSYGSTRAAFKRTFICNTRKMIYDLFDFFDAKQGRLGSFYVPTFMGDIIISAEVDSTDLTLTTRKLYMTADEIVGQHIYIRLEDKSYVCREITARPSTTSITIDTPIGTDIPTADLKNTLCCFLHESRFGVDEITYEYYVENIAETKLRFDIL